MGRQKYRYFCARDGLGRKRPRTEQAGRAGQTAKDGTGVASEATGQTAKDGTGAASGPGAANGQGRNERGERGGARQTAKARLFALDSLRHYGGLGEAVDIGGPHAVVVDVDRAVAGEPLGDAV